MSKDVTQGELVITKMATEDVDFGAILKALQADAEKKDPEKKVRDSKATRMAEWDKALDKLPIEKLVELQEKMSDFVDLKFAKVVATDPRLLTREEQYRVVDEWITMEEIKDAFDARHNRIRLMVLEHITKVWEQAGDKDPANKNGEIVVEELGYKFCKEGTGYKEPSLDLKKLRELLKSDWDKVTDRVMIPAHTEVVFNEYKLKALLRDNPKRLEDVRTSLIPGEAKTPRLTPRKI